MYVVEPKTKYQKKKLVCNVVFLILPFSFVYVETLDEQSNAKTKNEKEIGKREQKRYK